MPKSLKEYCQEVKSLKGISLLPLQFLPEILERKGEIERQEERQEREIQSEKNET